MSYADVHDRRGLRPLIHHLVQWPRGLVLPAALVPLERLSRFRREQNQLLRLRVSRGGFSGDGKWLFDVFRTGNINPAAAASCRTFRELPIRGVRLEHQNEKFRRLERCFV